MWRQFLLSLLLLVAAPLAAQDATFSLGGDAYHAGRNVTLSGDIQGDVFAAGNRVTLLSDIGGSGHFAGRNISVDGAVSGNLYAAGMDVEVDGAVSGNATLAANSVTVTQPISGNVRAVGADLIVLAPIGGSAILGGESVELDAVISGDVALGTEDMIWGDAAKIEGRLKVYTEDGEPVDVPERVIAASRISYHDMNAWDDDTSGGMDEERARPGLWAKISGLFGGVIVTGLFATLLAALAPNFTQSLRERALERPGRSLWMGALGFATMIGATLVLAMTGIGIFLAPIAIFGAIALGFAGYVIGAYLLGVWAVDKAGQGLPENTVDRAIAAFVGAGLMAILAMVPFIGWIAAYAVLLVGIGALVVRLFSPEFYTEV